jgi:hypothetical protein
MAVLHLHLKNCTAFEKVSGHTPDTVSASMNDELCHVMHQKQD